MLIGAPQGFSPTSYFLFIMNCIAWNCRGAASKKFPGRLKDMLQGQGANILVLTETRASGQRADMIIRRLGFKDWMRVEATGYARGIWLLWNATKSESKMCLPLHNFSMFRSGSQMLLHLFSLLVFMLNLVLT